MSNGAGDEDSAEMAAVGVAVRALLVTLHAHEAEMEALKAEVRRIEAAVSEGYVRGKLRRRDAGEP